MQGKPNWFSVHLKMQAFIVQVFKLKVFLVLFCHTSLQVCVRQDSLKLTYLARHQVSLPAFGHSPSGPESQRSSGSHCRTKPSGHQRRAETVYKNKKNSVY